MELIFHNAFRKGLEKLTSNQKHRVDQALDLFESNPFHPQLNNHGLKGKLKGFRAVSAGGDLCMIFREKENYHIVEFVLVGSHNQVY